MKNGNKTFRYIFVFLFIIVLFAAFASYFYYKSDNAVGPNLITAFVGVVLSALATLVLLNGQTKDEEEKERKLKLYNAKLEIYSDFVSSMYETLRDNQITEEEFINLRTKLLGKVCFYINNKEVLECITKELDSVKRYDNNDAMAKAFAVITSILQKDLREEEWSDTKGNVLELYRKFDEISDNTNKEASFIPNVSSEEKSLREVGVENTPERLEQQTWHFIMLDDTQLDRLKTGFNELSLIEYGEDWRTNLVKEVGKNDVVMLFRRGGYGYVGAYRAIGWRVFDFEKKQEEIWMFEGKSPQIISGDQYDKDVKGFDIYKSEGDGATTCANIIVEPIAFVENGVGNPGGVYRRTISRYDSHYAWLLKKRFQEKEQWIES